MNADDFKKRTKAFAVRIIKMIDSLPSSRSGDVICRQLLRSGSSVGANYRAACRARSQAEFIAKMGIVLEEADECCYWIELLVEANLVSKIRVSGLLAEANQIVAMAVSSIKTAKARGPGSSEKIS